ncbi:DUF4476 domain-containing protein [Sphingobacteriales bacterium UPWRP_1]|nr:hypothetical protein BVG80_01045 [Sphingobacteriales bacterium TSM_CSM]PSJ72631.1 DUF4476 domain-containing protein [Sphingobacteriales bacterium UPWRP_1]
MKKIFFATLFAFLAGFGAGNQLLKAQELSVLHVKMYNEAPITIILDGIRFRDIRPSFTIRNVPPGNHFLKVYKQRKNRLSMRLVFVDYIVIPENSEIFAYIDSEGRFRIHDAVPVRVRPERDPDDPYADDVQPQPRPRPADVRPDAAQPQPAQGNTAQPVQPAPGMADADFEQLRNTMKNQDYDDTRLNTVKQTLGGKRLNCYQLGLLLDVMSFESSKLELVKFAYTYLTDKEALNTVYNRFKFNSSIDELKKLSGATPAGGR